MSDTGTLSRAEYQDLVDARDAGIAMRDVASGFMPTAADADVKACLAAPTSLAFWRKHRGFTSAALAGQVSITQPYLAQSEYTQRGGRGRITATPSTAPAARPRPRSHVFSFCRELLEARLY